MRILLLVAPALALSACAGSFRDGRQPTTEHFGQAVTANTATSAAAARDADGVTDGARAAEAVNAYREGPSRQLSAPAASSVGVASE